MSKVDQYRGRLQQMAEWDKYLLAESGLPGPRGNIELAKAVAEEGNEALFRRYLQWSVITAPANTAEEFLAFCGVLGLGRLLADGRRDVLVVLREHASDARWRMREGVAMALQRWGSVDMEGLLQEMEDWALGSPLEQRAAAAALCEPVLLSGEAHVRRTLLVLDTITCSMLQVGNRNSDAFRTLRKGLGYCWSVAVAARPDLGKPAMEKWLGCPDTDVRWVMLQNLGKNRLSRADAAWVQQWRGRLGAGRARPAEPDMS